MKWGSAFQSLNWIRITVASNGTARPVCRFRVAFETTPTIHGSTSGPNLENFPA